MKRVAAMVCVWGMLCGILVGCKREATPITQPVTAGFRCDVRAEYGDMSLKGQLERGTDGVLSVELAEPPTLSGMRVSWDGETMTLTLGGMQVPVNADRVPQGALVRSLLSALAAAPADGEVTDEGVVASGEADGRAYTVVYAPDTGLLQSLRVPQDDLTVMFEHVTTI